MTNEHTDLRHLAVEVRGLRCRYGDHEAVRDVDLEGRRGELLALLGTNGAGKTTTLDVLQGLRAADAGTVRVLGLDPEAHRRRLADRVGVVFQEPALPDELTPAELLGLWGSLTGPGGRGRLDVDGSLAAVGLTHRRDLPAGRLSGGERRRLDLAVALSRRPELLFLDEPTRGLDPSSRLEAWELFRDLRRRGTTIVLTTHDLEEAEALADRLVILRDGRVRVAGTLEGVLAARDSRICCEVDREATPPAGALVGRVTVTPGGAGQLVEVRTPDMARDMETLLAWSRDGAVELRHLRGAGASLAEVFHDAHDGDPRDHGDPRAGAAGADPTGGGRR